MRRFHASAVLGKAYDFEKQCYPQHMYDSLAAAARRLKAGQISGGIIVCGTGDIKDLEKGKRAPLNECEEGFRYLVDELGVPEGAVVLDNQSTNTPDNYRYMMAIAEGKGWSDIHMPMAKQRIDRAAFLGWKICHGTCEFTYEGIESDDAFPTEEKLLGDMACALKDMVPGDSDYLVMPDGSSAWEAKDGPRKLHYACDYYVETDAVIAGTAPQNFNFHPPELMDVYGQNGAWRPRLIA